MYKIVLISDGNIVEVGDECKSISKCDKLVKEVCKNRGDICISKVGHLKTVRALQFNRSYAKKYNIDTLIGFIHYREVDGV